MSICRDEETKVKYSELKYSRSQYAETNKVKKNIQKGNTAYANIQRRGKQSEIYRTDILHLSICRDEESKVKSAEPKHCRCQKGKTKKAK